MHKIDLEGTWELSEQQQAEAIAATVPGDVYSALLAAGRIPDPYYGMNEKDVQWVAEKTWVLKRKVTVGAEVLAEDALWLSFESIDTFSEVRVNGTLVGTSDNMFQKQLFDVKGSLREGQNEIEVTLLPPVPRAREFAKKLRFPLPGCDNEDRNTLRKVQCHFGWDWGPKIITAGIYQGAALVATSGARIDYVSTAQEHAPSRCTVRVRVEATATRGGVQPLSIRLGDQKLAETVSLSVGTNVIERSITVEGPRLWWPVGQGEQRLYELEVKLGDASLERKIGLRSVEVLHEPDAEGNRPMTFRINGRDIFCKGANWIPADALPSRQTPEHCRMLLDAALDAHMNMIRVWGGGQYEPDWFYSMCDELGIMVWQDMMFACATYPTDEAYLESVRKEVTHQIKRLQDHPSIVLWCGDNENMVGLGWHKETKTHRARHVVNYDRLNHGVLERTIRALDPGREFWPSSPCNGPHDFAEDPNNDKNGDIHYWTVWHGRKPFEVTYEIKPRFASEFGYQSFPSMETVGSFATEDQWNVTSPVMEWHQRSGPGNAYINELMGLYYRLPPSFAGFVWVSQLQQARGLKLMLEYFRTLRPYCMGALYWQLNDVWPVCSWASLEYSGKWKLLHYTARQAYAPITAIALQKSAANVELYVVSDEARKFEGTLGIEILDLTGKVLSREEKKVTLDDAGSLLVDTLDLAKLPLAKNECFLRLELNGQGVSIENVHLFDAPKRYELPKASVRTEVTYQGDQPVVTVSTDQPAFFVTLEALGVAGHFDDGCTLVLPGRPKRIAFHARGSLDRASFEKGLLVEHLRATY
jgi:beta-mannosidase